MGEVGTVPTDPTVLLADADVLIDYRESDLAIVTRYGRSAAAAARSSARWPAGMPGMPWLPSWQAYSRSEPSRVVIGTAASQGAAQTAGSLGYVTCAVSDVLGIIDSRG